MDEIDRALAELAVKNGSSEAEMAAERAQQSIRADPKWVEIKEVRLCRASLCSFLPLSEWKS